MGDDFLCAFVPASWRMAEGAWLASVAYHCLTCSHSQRIRRFLWRFHTQCRELFVDSHFSQQWSWILSHLLEVVQHLRDVLRVVFPLLEATRYFVDEALTQRTHLGGS